MNETKTNSKLDINKYCKEESTGRGQQSINSLFYKISISQIPNSDFPMPNCINALPTIPILLAPLDNQKQLLLRSSLNFEHSFKYIKIALKSYLAYIQLFNFLFLIFKKTSVYKLTYMVISCNISATLFFIKCCLYIMFSFYLFCLSKSNTIYINFNLIY